MGPVETLPQVAAPAVLQEGAVAGEVEAEQPGPSLGAGLLLSLLASRFGQQARRKVEEEFRVSLVNDLTLQQYAQLLATPIRPSRLPWRPKLT